MIDLEVFRGRDHHKKAAGWLARVLTATNWKRKLPPSLPSRVGPNGGRAQRAGLGPRQPHAACHDGRDAGHRGRDHHPVRSQLLPLPAAELQPSRRRRAVSSSVAPTRRAPATLLAAALPRRCGAAVLRCSLLCPAWPHFPPIRRASRRRRPHVVQHSGGSRSPTLAASTATLAAVATASRSTSSAWPAPGPTATLSRRRCSGARSDRTTFSST